MKTKLKYGIIIFIVLIIILSLPIAILFMLETPPIDDLLERFSDLNRGLLVESLISYLSVGSSVVLAVVVYQQTQIISKYEKAEYDIYVGVDGLNYMYDFGSTFIQNIDEETDFFISRSYHNSQTTFVSNLKCTVSETTVYHFLPLHFVTKNHRLITALEFTKITLCLYEGNKKHTERSFKANSNIIEQIFKDNSEFVFGIGVMVPESIKFNRLKICLEVSVRDQLGEIQNKRISVSLSYLDSRFYLESTQSS